MNEMTCQQVEELLAEFVEGTLGRTVRPGVEKHLEGCAACRAEVADMTLAFQFSRAAEAPALPDGLIHRILEQTTGEPEVKPAVPWRQRFLEWTGPFFRPFLEPMLEPRIVMGTAMALISFSLVLNVAGVDVRRMELADLNPAHVYWNANSKVHLAGAKMYKYYSDLRVVYEIQTQLQAMRDEAAPAETPKAQPESTEPKKENAPQPEDKSKPLPRKWSREVGLLAAALPMVCK